jgi:hypothetical protein
VQVDNKQTIFAPYAHSVDDEQEPPNRDLVSLILGIKKLKELFD